MTNMEEEQDLCAICQENIFLYCSNNNCDHWFCFECLFKWTKNRRRSGVSPRCPVCREEYQRFYMPIEAESILNSVERIVYGQNRRHTPLNQYYLRRLIHSPHWNHLDNFWERMHIFGVIHANNIVFMVLIDDRPDITEWFLNKHFEFTIESNNQLLKSYQNDAFVMALIECNRHENV